jgi:hypothetical protein
MHALRIWTGLHQLRPLILNSEGPTTAEIFQALHRASSDCRWMIEANSPPSNISVPTDITIAVLV